MVVLFAVSLSNCAIDEELQTASSALELTKVNFQLETEVSVNANELHACRIAKIAVAHQEVYANALRYIGSDARRTGGSNGVPWGDCESALRPAH